MRSKGWNIMFRKVTILLAAALSGGVFGQWGTSGSNIYFNGGKAIINSQDNSFGQLQIGNSANGGEPSISFISGVSGFGGNPTSVNGDYYIWGMGANIYGIGGNKWGVGNKGAQGCLLTVQSDGKVGIGITSPEAKLDVRSNIDAILGVTSSVSGCAVRGEFVGSGPGKAVMGFSSTSGYSGYFAGGKFYIDGNTGIGTDNTTTFKKLQVVAAANGTAISGENWSNYGNGVVGYTGGTNQGSAVAGYTDNANGLCGFFQGGKFQVNARMGINTTPVNGYCLAVEGKIGCRELIVTTVAWADHVFKPDYNLKPLNEVERFIKTNKHLEGIPTEKEVKTNGVAVGDLQARLLQKVEELTLYTIELNKKVDQLSKDNEALNKKLKAN